MMQAYHCASSTCQALIPFTRLQSYHAGFDGLNWGGKANLGGAR